jgi:hypothetical protein
VEKNSRPKEYLCLSWTSQSHHCGRLNATAISEEQLSKKPLFDHARHAAAASKQGKAALAAQMD